MNIHKFSIKILNRLVMISAVALIISLNANAQQRPLDVRVVNAASEPVSVSNSGTSPLSVRDVDKISRQPLSHLISLGFSPGTFDSSPNPVPALGSYTVPARKRLVIEDASAIVHVPVGQKAHIFMRLIAPDNNPFSVRQRPLTLTFQMSDSPTDVFVAGEPVRIYLEAGARVEAWGRRTGVSGSGFVELVINGYLADVP